jgi:hypothetical protein
VVSGVVVSVFTDVVVSALPVRVSGSSMVSTLHAIVDASATTTVRNTEQRRAIFSFIWIFIVASLARKGVRCEQLVFDRIFFELGSKGFREPSNASPQGLLASPAGARDPGAALYGLTSSRIFSGIGASEWPVAVRKQ